VEEGRGVWSRGRQVILLQCWSNSGGGVKDKKHIKNLRRQRERTNLFELKEIEGINSLSFNVGGGDFDTEFG